jgi:hypothetical protein
MATGSAGAVWDDRFPALGARDEVGGGHFVVLSAPHIALGPALASLRNGHGDFSFRS